MSLNRALWISAGVLLLAVFCFLAKWHAGVSITGQLRAELTRTLPQQLQYMMPGWDQESVSWHHLASEINADLQTLPLASPGPLAACTARVTRLQSQQIAQPATGERLLNLQWQEDDDGRSLELGLRCEPDWLYIVSTQTLLVLALAGFALLIPRPLSARRRDCLRLLRQRGASFWQAWQWTSPVDRFGDRQLYLLDLLLEHLPQQDVAALRDALNWLASAEGASLAGDQLPWFELGLRQAGGDVQQAAAIARAPAELVFLPGESQVRVHGLPIKLPTTPFLYYFWYAMRRLRDGAGDEGGWFINPPSSGADHEHASELVTLMEANQGNSKATRELKENGLRSKILDQNRSKVKEHLSGLLGEGLAAEYLFELERDPRTARFRYRLALPAQRIRVESGLESAAGAR